MASATDDVTGEATELLTTLIRNACVNDGTVESGQEARNVDALRSHLEGPGLDLETYEPAPGRTSLVGRIEGSDPTAPTLLLMGHTDVVPVSPEGWSRDPFGGELVDGEVWGRGAVDMLNLTSTMAVAVRRLADAGWRPAGTLVYLAVADEEASGTWGAGHLVRDEADAVSADYVVTEMGGIQMPTEAGPRLPVLVDEKGSYWSTITVRGTPGHGSQPFRSDNALVTAAEVVRRLAEFRPPATISDTWRRFIEGIGFPAELTGPLLDPDSVEAFAAEHLPLGMGRIVYSSTHLTISPNVARGGTKVNVIPDEVTIEVDVRTLPGQTGEEVHAILMEAIGADLADRVELVGKDDPSTSSPTDTPLWDSLGRVSAGLAEGSALVPMVMVGGTDARFFRRAGATAYGFGLFSSRLSYEDYATMFHGHDERVDQESLRLSTELWLGVAKDLLGG